VKRTKSGVDERKYFFFGSDSFLRRRFEMRKMLLVMAVAVFSSAAYAEVRLPKIFSSEMVLQRGMKIPVWGWGQGGEKVTVKLGDKSAQVVTGSDGKWKIELPVFEAGGPYDMTVTGKNTVTFKNVLVGDVWLCSGQSNMTVLVSEAKNGKQEIAAANYPKIRLFQATYDMDHLANRPKPDLSDKGYCWSGCTPKTISTYSAIAYFFGRDLYKAIDVPIGLIHVSWGATCIDTWTPREVLMKDALGQKEFMEWDTAWDAYRKDKTKKNPNQANNPNEFCVVSNQPAGLFNGAIHPLIPYAIRGVIWYQGEGNTPEPNRYLKLFPAMIQGWRKAWGQGNFPFLYVQLANYDKRLPEPSGSDWAELRESQMLAQKTLNTAMITAIDIGEEANIHPINKQEVGRRLALAAQALVYGKKVVYSGPVYQSMKIDKGTVRLRFKQVNGGLVVNGPELKGFAIAGDDKKFVWAKAKIEGDSVVVWNDAVKKPVAVRYAWAKNPECNLYNKEGLPAFPFRTDKWPGIAGR
jgi:sialate O-acetylesterase